MTTPDHIKQMAESVYFEMGAGHTESVYHAVFQVELRLSGIQYDTQRQVALFYKGHCVGRGAIDLLVKMPDGEVILELKATASAPNEGVTRQIRKYMVTTGIERGAIINFGKSVKGEPEVSLQFVSKDGTHNATQETCQDIPIIENRNAMRGQKQD